MPVIRFHPLRALLHLLIAFCGLWLLAGEEATGRSLSVQQVVQKGDSLTPYLAVLEDAGGRLSFAEIQKPEVQAGFRTDSTISDGFNFGFTQSAFWLRLELENGTAMPLERMLELAFNRISSIHFYQPDQTGAYHRLETGNALPFASRPYRNRYYVFPLTLPPGAKQTYYFRIQSESAILFPARLWSPQAFHEHERNDYLVQAWYVGCASAMILFNLLLFVILRDPIYLRYVAATFFMALAMMAQNGLVTEYLALTQPPAWFEYLPTMCFSLAAGSFLLFMRRMLDTPVSAPKADHGFAVFAWLHLLTPLALVLWYRHLGHVVTQFYLATIVLIMGTALYLAFHRQRSAIVFVAVFSVLFFTATLNTLTGLGILPSNIVTHNALQIGSASEMVLLALALADRFATMRREKERMQGQLVENLKASEKLLEDRVVQRTEELSKSNEALSVANLELKAAVELAESSREQAEAAEREASRALEEARRSQVLLEKSEAELRIAAAAFDSQEVILITDAQGIIVRVNKAFVEATGYTAEDALGRTPDLLRSDRHTDDFHAAMWQAIRTRHGWQGEIWDRHKDGSVHPQWRSVSAVRDDSGHVTHYVWTQTDITQRKLAEAAEVAREAAEASSKAKDQFLGSMSHELRTPLNSILGYAQLLTVEQGLAAPSREMAEEIEAAGRHLLALVDDIIDLARIESGKLEMSLEPIPVFALATASISMVDNLAKQHGVSVVIAGCHDQCRDAKVMADRVRLRQIMVNLLTNAIKYNRPQGHVTLSCCAGDHNIRIVVTDTGAGIPQAMQQRLFTAFDRLGKEAGAVEGTGIGLNITRRLAEAMGGCIGFISEPGQGSSFWVELPLVEGEAHVGEVLAAQPARPDVNLPGLEILYIEDNPMNLRLMSRVFEQRLNVRLCHALSAEAGLEMVHALKPALILMDINLPGMNGYEALARLRADPRTALIPVVAISANAMLGDREKGLRAGFDAYVTKPIEIGNFVNLIEGLLKART